MLGRLMYSCLIVVILLNVSNAVYHMETEDQGVDMSTELRNHPAANYVLNDGSPLVAHVREFIPIGLKRKRDHTLQKLLNLLKKVADHRQKPIHIIGKHMRFGISKK
ncbi:uncharacterized protein LOC111083590 [Limulus polyphemus]|uniref:Uncharacterized protein LOC111083590 n=1 Tax=Limulus polyphemus TaxID=6850 RepID=A0ABM1RX07_LIMPO|nr:uncharacterized protein LOC111083590 [Limulus polyphemus]